MTTILKYLKVIVIISIVSFSCVAIAKYKGHWTYYLIFSIIFNCAFLKGLFKPRFYFETFFYGFMWLGFWLKLSYHVVFENYQFAEAIGNFDLSNLNFDNVIWISTCAMISCALAVETISRIYPKQLLEIEKIEIPILNIYKKYWVMIWITFLLCVLCVGFININYGIYIRGMPTPEGIPGIIKSVVTWFVLTGFSCLTVTFIYWEMLLKRNIFLTLILSLLESLISNVSMLSRGFIISISSPLWSFLQQDQNIKKMNSLKGIALGILLVVFMAMSIIGVGYMRYARYPDTRVKTSERANHVVMSNAASLFIHRWVGLEGLMSVASYPHLGWDTWNKAWSEEVNENEAGFYDREISKSQYLDITISTQHFVTLPGLIAFLYYPGSIAFVTIIIALIVSIFIGLEILIKESTGNAILSALFAQSAAYKIMHFGYTPSQSWKYFFAFSVMIAIIFVVQKANFVRK